MQTVTPQVSLLLRERKRGLTCKCCQGKFNGHKYKLTVHIAGNLKKFLNNRNMDVRSCTPAALITTVAMRNRLAESGRLVVNSPLVVKETLED